MDTVQVYEIGRLLFQNIGPAAREVSLNFYAVFRPTQAAQSLAERREKRLPLPFSYRLSMLMGFFYTEKMSRVPV